MYVNECGIRCFVNPLLKGRTLLAWLNDTIIPTEIDPERRTMDRLSSCSHLFEFAVDDSKNQQNQYRNDGDGDHPICSHPRECVSVHQFIVSVFSLQPSQGNKGILGGAITYAPSPSAS